MLFLLVQRPPFGTASFLQPFPFFRGAACGRLFAVHFSLASIHVYLSFRWAAAPGKYQF